MTLPHAVAEVLRSTPPSREATQLTGAFRDLFMRLRSTPPSREATPSRSGAGSAS